MPARWRAWSAVAGLALLAVACGAACSSHGAAAGAPPVAFAVGGFTVRVAPDAASPSIAGPDGRALVDGIASSTDVGNPA
jgi:hypothetical protein